MFCMWVSCDLRAVFARDLGMSVACNIFNVVSTLIKHSGRSNDVLNRHQMSDVRRGIQE